MTARILEFPASRIKRIPPAIQQGYDDEAIARARQIEERAYQMWAREMAGACPADVEQK